MSGLTLSSVNLNKGAISVALNPDFFNANMATSLTSFSGTLLALA